MPAELLKIEKFLHGSRQAAGLAGLRLLAGNGVLGDGGHRDPKSDPTCRCCEAVACRVMPMHDPTCSHGPVFF